MGSEILRLMAFFDLKNHSGKVLSFQKVDCYKEGGGILHVQYINVTFIGSLLPYVIHSQSY